MNTKIIRHLTVENNEPAVEFERVNLWGEVERGISLTNGLEGQALIDDIEKHSVIADKFSASGEIVDELPVGSIEWRWQQDADAGAHYDQPWEIAQRNSKQHTPSKPPKPQKAKATPSSASASIPTEAHPMHAQER